MSPLHEAKARLREARRRVVEAKAWEQQVIATVFDDGVAAATDLARAAVDHVLAYSRFRALIDAGPHRWLDNAVTADDLLLVMDQNDDVERPVVVAELSCALDAAEGWLGRDGAVELMNEVLAERAAAAG